MYHSNKMLLFLLGLPGVFIIAAFLRPAAGSIGFFVPYHAPSVPLRHAGSGCELFGAMNITPTPSPTIMIKSEKHES